MSRLRGVILDVDGTLVDSNDAHAEAWVEALAAEGVRVSFAEVRPLIGMGGDKLLERLVGWSEESPEGKRTSDRRREIFEQRYVPALRPTPGARRLLERFRDQGLRMIVASSAKEDELGALLEAAGAADLVEERTSSDDAENSKPDPDIVARALERIGLGASEVLMLGDTPWDVEAADQVGVDTVAVRSGGWGDDELTGAVAIYDHPADILAHYDDSPFARRR
jgi:HAD superfamily hydrolase (TIGR01509 family)